MDKVSYALGLSMGQRMSIMGVTKLNFDDFLKGVKVMFGEGLAELALDETNQILNDYFGKIREEMRLMEEKERKENLKRGEKYLKENAGKEGVQTTKSGLQYKVISQGTGTVNPTGHSRVRVHYEGRLIDGTVFDSSYKRGEPTEFGLDQVIPGWAEGLQLMKEGDVYELTIPANLGYGEVGIPDHIPGNSVLIFKVELIKIL